MLKLENKIVEKIKDLASSGLGVVAISNELKLSQPTVSKYMKILGFKTGMTTTSNEELLIIKLYSEGTLIKDIAGVVGKSRPTIRKVLQKHNLSKTIDEIQYGSKLEDSICDLYSKGNTLTEIAKELNISYGGARKVLIKHGTYEKIPLKVLNTTPFKGIGSELSLESSNFVNKPLINTEYSYEEAANLFKEFNSETAYYWLGFLYADGCVTIKPNARVSLVLSSTDKAHVVKYCNDLSIPLENIRENTTILKGKVYSNTGVMISSVLLCKELVKLGVVPRKSLILYPPKRYMDPRLIKHFIRGYFDGDGTIYNNEGNLDISLLGTLEMVDWIGNHLKSVLGDNCLRRLGQKDLDKNSFTLSLKQNYALDFLNYIYLDSTVSLNRKYIHYKEIAALS